jgi:hypothetical protein
VHQVGNQSRLHDDAGQPTIKIRYSCQILIKLGLSRQIFEKSIEISNFIKIHPVGADSFYADGQKGRG